MMHKLGDGKRCTARERMALRNGKQKTLLEQEFGAQLIVVDRQSQNRGIDLTLAQARQQATAFFFDKQQLEVGVTLPDLWHDVREKVWAERRKNSEADCTSLGILILLGTFFQLLNFEQNMPGPCRSFVTTHLGAERPCKIRSAVVKRADFDVPPSPVFHRLSCWVE
jgi:hypothetical protein